MIEIAKIAVNGVKAVCEKVNTATSGMVGATVTFTFDPSWNGLTKTAVFRAGDVSRDVVGIRDVVVIPHEVLAKPLCKLTVGVYGTNADGTLAIPTVTTPLCCVTPGANPSGDPSADPTLPPWVDLQKQVDELKRNPGGEISPGAVEEAVQEYLEQNPPAQGAPGRDGEDGRDGKDGKDGYTPVKYLDYFTPSDVQEIAEAAAELVEVPEGGGGIKNKKLRLVAKVTLDQTELPQYVEITEDMDGKPFAMSEFIVLRNITTNVSYCSIAINDAITISGANGDVTTYFKCYPDFGFVVGGNVNKQVDISTRIRPTYGAGYRVDSGLVNKIKIPGNYQITKGTFVEVWEVITE